jgi:hypothetical protein
MQEQIKCPRCRIYLLAHPANRCLDNWIAEYVMGWESMPDEENFLENLPKNARLQTKKLRGPQWERQIPNYSRDVAATWQIIELLRLNNCRWQISNKDSEWIVCYRSVGENKFEARAHTVMLAICYVALQAVIHT